MSDYFCAILGLVRQGSSWAFNPFEEMRNADHSLFERGRGNACSVEVRVPLSSVVRPWSPVWWLIVSLLLLLVQLLVPLACDYFAGR